MEGSKRTVTPEGVARQTLARGSSEKGKNPQKHTRKKKKRKRVHSSQGIGTGEGFKEKA